MRERRAFADAEARLGEHAFQSGAGEEARGLARDLKALRVLLEIGGVERHRAVAPGDRERWVDGYLDLGRECGIDEAEAVEETRPRPLLDHEEVRRPGEAEAELV